MGRVKNTCLKRCFTWTFVLRIVMVISIILAIWRRDWVWVVATFIGLFISLIPTILKRDVKFSLPWVFDFLIAIISILHVGGRLLDYYYTIPGYQLMTRFFISILVAFIALAIMYILDEHWDGLIMDKYAIAFLTVIVTMAIGVILEFVKWLNITGTYYVRENHILMENLTADTTAGIIIAIIGVFLIKSGRFDELTDEFSDQVDKIVIDRLEERGSKKKT